MSGSTDQGHTEQGHVHVVADRDVCIGAGMCVMSAEDVFDQDDDGLVRLLVEDPADGTAVRRAVEGCPSGALRIAAEQTERTARARN
ncbi:ferredoxin [Pseudonocardia sp. SCN 73-27]|uniref:ferredoxin n=1 Tax=unclassified Pseudonocardia TaxID=2619320 RepID=UPI000A74327E